MKKKIIILSILIIIIAFLMLSIPIIVYAIDIPKTNIEEEVPNIPEYEMGVLYYDNTTNSVLFEYRTDDVFNSFSYPKFAETEYFNNENGLFDFNQNYKVSVYFDNVEKNTFTFNFNPEHSMNKDVTKPFNYVKSLYDEYDSVNRRSKFPFIQLTIAMTYNSENNKCNTTLSLLGGYLKELNFKKLTVYFYKL